MVLLLITTVPREVANIPLINPKDTVDENLNSIIPSARTNNPSCSSYIDTSSQDRNTSKISDPDVVAFKVENEIR
jgi:hypothetical protein